MENIFEKIINFLKFKERPILGPLFTVIILIVIVLIVSFGNNIMPFIYTAF
jgi:hypothetical protein